MNQPKCNKKGILMYDIGKVADEVIQLCSIKNIPNEAWNDYLINDMKE